MFLDGRIFNGLWSLISIGLAAWAVWWTYRDAKSRGMTAWVWTAVALLFFPLGFIIYLIVRAFSKPKNPA
ncbi:phospholipase D-like protein [Hydrogenispora ethanolica]|uniref:Phospholipase D-like protein n=1 Tax=Hydrogenispora ethanolica TaxID=1082276 RepID=A0A4R1RMB5_HYDET|nr:PLDc N-terminal domain-containing protein [Hydrogenispora ethanolica]TCL67411.1 phospholipase D-like protein [Hydrogenispora ethanolica]